MNEQVKNKSGNISSTLKALVFGAVVFTVLVLIAAGVFNIFLISESFIPTVFYIILFISAFITGLRSSHNKSSKGYLRGLLSGVAFVAVLWIVFSFFKKPITGRTYITYIIALLLSSFGGIIGINGR